MKVTHFVRMQGITNHIFKPSLVYRHAEMKVYKTLVSYGNKSHTIEDVEGRLLQAERRFMMGCEIHPFRL